MNKNRIIGVLVFLLFIAVIVMVVNYRNDRKKSINEGAVSVTTQPASKSSADGQGGSFASSPNKISSAAAEQNLNPRIFMPLAVGNSWTYVWKNKISSSESDPEDKRKPSIYGMSYFEAGDTYRISFLNGMIYSLVTHHDTYTITRKEKSNYFFEIGCTGECEGVIFSDGRYDKSIEKSWSWIENHERGFLNIILLESIKCKLENIYMREDFVALQTDTRTLIHVLKEDNWWKIVGWEATVGEWLSMDFDYRDHTVVVPADKFDNCLLITESYHARGKDGPVNFKVFKFYAPNVGKVKEYEQLEDGTITYTMELESFKLVK